MKVSTGIEISVEEVSRKYTSTAEVSRIYTTNLRTEARSNHQVSRSYQAYISNLDRSTRYRGPSEIAIRKSLRKLDR